LKPESAACYRTGEDWYLARGMHEIGNGT